MLSMFSQRSYADNVEAYTLSAAFLHLVSPGKHAISIFSGVFILDFDNDKAVLTGVKTTRGKHEYIQLVSTSGVNPIEGVFGTSDTSLIRGLEYELVSIDGNTAVSLTGDGTTRKPKALNKQYTRGKLLGVRCVPIGKRSCEVDEDSQFKEVEFYGKWNMSRAKTILSDNEEK